MQIMKFKLAFLCMFCIGTGHFVKPDGLPEFANSEDLSFFAAVETLPGLCSAVFVTENYIAVPASCVNGSSSVKVFPYVLGIPEPNAEFLISTDIFVHEEFVKIKPKWYLNNIALVKLPKRDVKRRPGKLITREQVHLMEGSLVKVSGYIESRAENILNFVTVQVENKDTCNYLLGNTIIRNQEICLKTFTPIRHVLMGNVLTVNDTIIGFVTKKRRCVLHTPHCRSIRLGLIFRPFLNWMSDKMNIPIEQFTSNSSDNSYLTKTEGVKLQKKLNNLKAEIATGSIAQNGLKDLEAKNDLDKRELKSQHKLI